MKRIHVILASYSRREKTLRCLEALMRQEIDEFSINVTVFDDGSEDDTVEMIRKNFVNVIVKNGDGNQYWCRSMCAAYDHVSSTLKSCDYLLCINDDIELDVNAIQMMLSQISEHNRENTVIAGLCHNANGELVYGGLQRVGKIKYILNDRFGVEVDTMNFNCVLIPNQILDKFGFLDPEFEHSMGDIEYGLRLSSGGVKILNSIGFVACCEENNLVASFKKLNIFQRCKLVISKKYFPVRSWLHFVKKTCGNLWFIYFAYPYIRFTVFGSK